jgi:hypothetical protein
VRSAFRSAVSMAIGVMLVSALICYFAADRLMAVFSQDADVIATGVEYLRIVCWSFVASGVVFVASSMFQALGNTIPPLITSLTRIRAHRRPPSSCCRACRTSISGRSGICRRSGVVMQMLVNLYLLQREMRIRLPLATNRRGSAFLVGVVFLQLGDDGGSASVVVSPSALPSAMSRSSRRMILPDRVFGRSAANRI